MPSSPILYTPSATREATLARYIDGPPLLERTIAGLRPDELDKPPTGGGWTIRQIVHHIADGDDIWKTCIKMALGNEDVEFTLGWYWSLTQKEWADRWGYSSRSPEESLALLKAIRYHIHQLLMKKPEGWARSVAVRDSKGRLERVTVGFVVEMQADHLVHHVNRIREIQTRSGGT